MLKKFIRYLDEQWAYAVKETAGWKCEYCGLKGGRVEAAHVVGRRHRATRWGAYLIFGSEVVDGIDTRYDLCGHCLCHRCHQQYDEHGPLEKDIVRVVVGLERKEAIQILAKSNVTKYQDYEEVSNILRDAVIMVNGSLELFEKPVKK